MTNVKEILVQNNTVVKRYIKLHIEEGTIQQISTDCPHLLGFLKDNDMLTITPIITVDVSDLRKLDVEFLLIGDTETYKAPLMQVYNLDMSAPNVINLHIEFVAFKDRSSYIS